MNIDKIAFEQFSSLDGVLRGEPIKVFPVGRWFRDSRVLNITAARLQQFARNIKDGLPRFEVPITLEHNRELGRYGSVLDLEYFERGPDGPGLYATRYAFTDEGRKLLEQERFKGVSGEAVWTLFDGATYQDPVTGNQYDNCLVGLSLTNSSYFGRDVALFSAAAPPADGFAALRAKAAQADALRYQLEEAKWQMAQNRAALAAVRDDRTQNTNPPPVAADYTQSTWRHDMDTQPQFKTDFEKAVDVRAAELARARGVPIADGNRRYAEVYTEAFDVIRVERPDLAERHSIVSTAAQQGGAYMRALTSAEKFAVEQHWQQVEKFAADAARPEPERLEPFAALVERVLVESFNGDRTLYAEAMSEAGRRNPRLAREYLGHSSAGVETFAEMETIAVAGLQFGGEAKNTARRAMQSGMRDEEYDLIIQAATYGKNRTHDPAAANAPSLVRAAGLAGTDGTIKSDPAWQRMGRVEGQ